MHPHISHCVSVTVFSISKPEVSTSDNIKWTECAVSLSVLTEQTKALTYSLAQLGGSKKNKILLRSLKKPEIDIRTVKKSYHDLDLDLHHVIDTFH